MLILLVLPLTLSKQFQECSLIKELRNTSDYFECLETSKNCNTLQSNFEVSFNTCIINSGLTATSQSLSDFIAGFFNGIQKDAAQPSPCIRSFPYIKTSIENFIYGIKQFGFSPLVQILFNFNEFINRLAATYALCNFSTLYSIFHPGTIWKQFSFIFSHWLLAKDEVRETWEKLFKALDSGNFVSAGIYSGKLVTLLTSYSL
jgi:hypothetical protein